MPDRPIRGYRALAAELREQITSGVLRPGERVPSERDLMQMYGLGRDTVRDAIAALSQEGLVVVRHGFPTRVRKVAEKQDVVLEPGQRVSVRMPTPEERERFGLPSGVPVLVISDVDGSGNAYPGDQVDAVHPPVASTD